MLTQAANAVARVFRPLAKQFFPAAGGMEAGGFVPAFWPINYWQSAYRPLPFGGSATVQACISAYAQTSAMCAASHWRREANGGRTRVDTSPLSRVLRSPNAYQSISDFMLNLLGMLYEEGNAYALCRRDARFQITELHLLDPRQSAARVATNGEVFYHLAGNEIVDRIFGGENLAAVPARDVLHLRLNARRHPLQGESPLCAAMTEVAASNALVAQALAYTSNQGRPSGVIETELKLTEIETRELRERWNAISQGANAGGTPILSSGLKWKAVSVNSRDAQLAEMLQISDQRIASVYRVPLPLLSLLSGNGPQGATEQQMLYWIATGLGFALNHVEEAIGRLFGLAGWPDDYVELDTASLERSAFKDRIDGLVKGVQGGVFSPNEARAIEELPPAPYGDEPRVQQQVVPLSAWEQTANQAEPAAPPEPAPPAGGAEEDEGDAAERAIRAYRAARAA
jgi:HK97 family phage portal protein